MGERQYGTLSQIRKDHTERYRFVAEKLLLDEFEFVSDLGCGCGYGSYLMAQKGLEVTAIDRSEEALNYAKMSYKHPRIDYRQEDVADIGAYLVSGSHAAVAFEVLEHLDQNDADAMLAYMVERFELAYISVPNQAALPFNKNRFPYHYRHYTMQEFGSLLEKHGFVVRGTYGQEGASSPVHPSAKETDRTIIFRVRPA